MTEQMQIAILLCIKYYIAIYVYTLISITCVTKSKCTEFKIVCVNEYLHFSWIMYMHIIYTIHIRECKRLLDEINALDQCFIDFSIYQIANLTYKETHWNALDTW